MIETGWPYGTYGREEGCIQCFDGETEGEKTLGNSGADGRIIFKWSFNK